MAETRISIFGSIGAALKSYPTNWRAVAVAALLGAVLSTLFSILSISAPALGLIWSLLSIAVSGYVYAALTGAALQGSDGLSQRVAAEGARVLGAVAIVGFFLFVIFVVTVFVDAFVIVFAASEYLPQLQAAGQDQTAALAVMTRYVQEKPWPIIIVGLINAVIWYALTSRLYLAAPATYDTKKILTFETWPWTKGNMLRITAARLILLLPIYCLTSALGYGIYLAMGVNIFDPTAIEQAIRAAPAKFAVLSLIAEFLHFACYFSLEAALSAQMYRTLRPQARVAETF